MILQVWQALSEVNAVSLPLLFCQFLKNRFTALLFGPNQGRICL